MHQIKDLCYDINERKLLQGVTWSLQKGQRAALIGPNGAGKTTLFRIIVGEISEYQGQIIKPRDYRIAYLPQEEISIEAGTVMQTVISGCRDVLDLEEKMAELYSQLDSTQVDHKEILAQLGNMEHRYAALQGYSLESSAKAVLSGLGFTEDEMSQPLSRFSGGWRMRAYLARLLVQNPDLLLLDEPTNHLDLPSLEWLEQYLLDFSGSIVVVSHDRFFIDRLAQNIYELEQGKLEFYPGNYHYYEKKKNEKALLLQKQWEEQQAERKRQERFIERFRYKATKAAQVQSRIKQLEKMEKIIIPFNRPRLGFSLKVGVPSYKDVLSIENMSFHYPKQKEWILENVNLHIMRGERIALVGVNGAGKTTLTRLIVSQLKPQAGRVLLGKRTNVGYYAQHQVAALDLNASVYDEVAATVADNYHQKIRDGLGIFQFSGDEVFKIIKVLSGGEKARVSLAKILLSPVNFLIMDEPTNHLDIASREALENALQDYDGTLLLISHDRYFLDKLVHRVIEIKEGGTEEYYGNYSYYLEKRIAEKNRSPAEKPEGARLSSPAKKSKEQKRREAEARQSVSQERRHLETKVMQVEQEIEKLESRKTEIETSLCQPETLQKGGELVMSLQKELAGINSDLQKKYHSWEEERIKLEELLNGLKKEAQ